MQKILTNCPAMTLVGLKTRTNNANEFAQTNAKIGPLVNKYFSENVAGRILQRKNPGVTIVVYTNYESDEHGDYDYFIGEEVTALDSAADFVHLAITPGKYQKFTTESGNMTAVIIAAWQKIWRMNEAELGGKRLYLTDFEVSDHRAADPSNAVVDIYIGVS